MPDRIARATELDFVRFYRVAPPPRNDWIGWVLKNGSFVKSIAGVAKSHDGRYFGFMDLSKAARYPLIFRKFKKSINIVAEELGLTEIFVTCDKRYERAEEFLIHLGFTETDEVFEDQKVWKCRVLKP